ncbi:MAG: hypothetical protein EZS28_038969, partial [Streblomastix strix]
VLGVIFLLCLLGYLIPYLIVRFSKPLDLNVRYGGGFVFITGGNSGIGEAFAKKVAAMGLMLFRYIQECLNADSVAYLALSSIGRITRVDSGFQSIFLRLAMKVIDANIIIKIIRKGSYGCVFLAYHLEYGIIALKICQKIKYNKCELETGLEFLKDYNFSPFICTYLGSDSNQNLNILVVEYANMKTLDIITKQPQIPLPSFTFRALMKQILEGLRVFHSAGLVHRDIKCDNILLHCPPGSGRVYAKISDFGFAKK